MLSFLYDFLQAIIVAGVPVGFFSFTMIYYAYSRDYLAIDLDIKQAFKKQHSEQSALSKKHKKNLHFFHSKWVTFGGGFYGLIALLTFLVIELSQVYNFFSNLDRWQDVSQLLTLNALISMFVDSIVNMITAAIWFTYWPNELSSLSFWIVILVAYIAYRLAGVLAKNYAINQQQKIIE